jgi:hypothetical protein
MIIWNQPTKKLPMALQTGFAEDFGFLSDGLPGLSVINVPIFWTLLHHHSSSVTVNTSL